MKLTKALCLVAATAALALAPINTSTGQTNTVLASQKVQDIVLILEVDGLNALIEDHITTKVTIHIHHG